MAPTSFPLGAQVTAADLSRDPYPVFHRLRPAEPVSWCPQLGQWLVTRRDLAMEVLRDPVHFRTDGGHSPIRDTFGPQMLSTEGDQQRRYKSACAPPFNARAVEDARGLVEGVVARCLAALPRHQPIELRTGYAAPIALEVVARVLGLPSELDARLRTWYDTFAEALMNYEQDEATRTRAHAAVQAFRAAIAPRLAAPDPAEASLIATLARAHPRLLDDAEITSNALIVLFGGIETTEASIANAAWAMLTHPEALGRARASDDDLVACLEESFRWEPAVQTCTRYTSAPCELGGVAIPDGATVQCMIGAMNRDPATWQDPDRYDPWRAEPRDHTAFGFGRHFCLGAALARLEARTALRALLDAAPGLTMDAGRTQPPAGHEFRKPPALVVTLA